MLKWAIAITVVGWGAGILLSMHHSAHPATAPGASPQQGGTSISRKVSPTPGQSSSGGIVAPGSYKPAGQSVTIATPRQTGSTITSMATVDTPLDLSSIVIVQAVDAQGNPVQVANAVGTYRAPGQPAQQLGIYIQGNNDQLRLTSPAMLPAHATVTITLTPVKGQPAIKSIAWTPGSGTLTNRGPGAYATSGAAMGGPG